MNSKLKAFLATVGVFLLVPTVAWLVGTFPLIVFILVLACIFWIIFQFIYEEMTEDHTEL